MRRVMSIIFRPQCQLYYVHMTTTSDGGLFILSTLYWRINTCIDESDLEIVLDSILVCVLNKIDMPIKPLDDPKLKSLREQRALHRHPENVQDETFRSDDFFDPRDLVQVRYEMLRRHRIDGKAVSDVAHSFGVSRQAFYVTDASFRNRGLPGLLPRRRGPRRAHKCTDEILDFVDQWRQTADGKETIVEAVRHRFGVTINPRSIERALKRRKKKPPTKLETQG
jgi:transposase